MVLKEKDLLADLTLNDLPYDDDYVSDDEPIVIKMLDSMLARKKTVGERLY